LVKEGGQGVMAVLGIGIAGNREKGKKKLFIGGKLKLVKFRYPLFKF
jgi:hypothetical protein